LVCSVNSAPEDFSVKSQLRVSRDLNTSSNMKETADVDAIDGAFDLTPNNQPTDLRFNMYPAKRNTSPANSLYRNNPDPYLGGSQNGDRNSNGSEQEEFDLSVSQSSNFTAVAPDLTPSLPSYLESAENPDLASNDSFSTSRPTNNGPSEKYGVNPKVQSEDFRSSSTNSFSTSKNNSLPNARRSPLSTSSSQIHSVGVPSPLSPSSYNASGAERSISGNMFSASALGQKSSAFKPLLSNQVPGSQYPQHVSPPYQHGPSPSMTGNSQHIPGYLSPAGSLESNLPSHAYSNQNSAFDYGSNSVYRRKQTSSVDSDCQSRPPQTGSTPPNKNERQEQIASTNDQNKRVIVPAGKQVYIMHQYPLFNLDSS